MDRRMNVSAVRRAIGVAALVSALFLALAGPVSAHGNVDGYCGLGSYTSGSWKAVYKGYDNYSSGHYHYNYHYEWVYGYNGSAYYYWVFRHNLTTNCSNPYHATTH